MTNSSPVSDPDTIVQRIHSIRARIPADVEIMAVSKGVSVDRIRLAYEAGLRHFGESRVQEAKEKQEQLQDLGKDLIWHLIGHLQTNKAKLALTCFDWIDTLDSWKLAQVLQQRAWETGHSPQLCLQVKLAPDPQKQGWTVPDLLQSLPHLTQLSQLRIRGLMTILPQGLSSEAILSLFANLTELANRIRAMEDLHLDIQVISMGMSSDYELAIAAGATQIRLGRALFG